MEIVFLFIVSAVLWGHSWHMLNLYTNPRTMGLIGAAGAIALLGVVLFGQNLIIIGGTESPLLAFVLMWALYAAILAAVGLWGFDERTLGLYSLFMSVVSLLYVAYYFLGDGLLLDEGTSPTGVAAATVGAISYLMGIAALALTLLSALLFFYLAPPFVRMRTVTGWFYLVLSVVLAVLAGLVVLGLPVAAF